MADIGSFDVRTVETIRDGILRVVRNGLIAAGVVDPNVGPDSDFYLLATGLASELTVVEANAVIKADACMPDTATGDELRRWLDSVGLQFRTAVGAIGNVTMSAIAPSPVAAGQQLLDDQGLTFEVTTAGTYADGDPLPVQGVSTGFKTNHINGDVLKWVSTPAFANPTATVGLNGGTDGLIDGVDDEDEETARARLLDRLANPPSDYNWEHVAELVEQSSPTVQKCFVYPALQGPSSLQVCVVGFATSFLDIVGPSAARAISATIVSSIIAPYIKGILLGCVDVQAYTTNDVDTDVSIGLSLPSAPQASPAGPGGGWLDGTPWPGISGTAYTKATVTAVTSATVFTVDAPTAPTAGVSRIAWVSSANWKVYSARVVSFTGTGPYVVTVDTPFTSIATSEYIFPQSVNQAIYVKALLKAFAQMGPGEKSTFADVLARAFRHPPPNTTWPYSLDAPQLRALTDSGTEVLSATYFYRSTTTPAVPGALTDPPNILRPKRIGLYPQ